MTNQYTLAERIRYRAYKTALGLCASLPWPCIHALSRGLGWVLHRGVGYRRTVVQENIRRSFPELGQTEAERLAREFYRRFVMQFISAAKMLSQPNKTILQRHLKYEGLELFERLLRQGRPHSILLLGHCGNWELFSAGSLYLAPMGITQDQLYRPLRDRAADRLFLEMRTQHGSLVVPKSEIGRRMLSELKESNPQPRSWLFLSDQKPSRDHVNYWTLFLNQPTAFLDGAERLARKYNLPVIYMDIERLSDRQYVGHMKLICENPKEAKPYEITESYARMLEATIMRDKAGWLWSHKRWRYALEDYPKAVRSERLTDYLNQQNV